MLTKQENKIAQFIGAGFSDKEIADILYVSPKTITNHKANVFEKLGINKALELAIYVWCEKSNIEFDLNKIRENVLREIKEIDPKKAVAILAFLFATHTAYIDAGNSLKMTSRSVRSSQSRRESII